MMSQKQGQIITFYSYKGGTGRTMALANLACILSKKYTGNKKILMVDWDLDAPGLHQYFRSSVLGNKKYESEIIIQEKPGLIEFFMELEKATRQSELQSKQGADKLFKQINLKRYIIETGIPSLHLLKAGCFDVKYSYRVNKFNWEALYNRVPWLFLEFANYLASQYHYVLIDSRTGVTDISGICTMLMPEKLVSVFTPNYQSLEGIIEIIRRSTDYRKQADDLRPLVVFPLASRVEMNEQVLRILWKSNENPNKEPIGYQPKFEELFKEIYELPECNLTDYFDEVLIQHSPYYAYGEEIAVLDDKADDRLSFARSYESFAERLLNTNAPWETYDNVFVPVLKSGPPASKKRKVEKTPSKGLFRILLEILKFRGAKKYKFAELEAEKEFKEREQFEAARTAEDIYRAALQDELGTLHLLGTPDLESKPVRLEDAFVSLCISESWRSEKRFEKPEKIERMEMERHLTAEQVMKRAFQNFRLLLVIGDPGSGKTTLLKYYTLRCLHKRHHELGFVEEVFPIFFPLRDLEFKYGSNEPMALPVNLANWAERHLLNISVEQFQHWLLKRKTLVLLDGLDEIGSKERRRNVCRWVRDMCSGLKNACFVLTSRATGYRKLDGIELEVRHLRADIMDFSVQQQEEFLRKWFRAACCSELAPEGTSEQEWKTQQVKRADQRSQTIIEYLQKEDNKALRELAAVPMLLQIMSIIWKEHEFLPQNRPALYDTALNYLLMYRDRQKGIDPLLPIEEARRVLAPTALWMQEELKRDEAAKGDVHETMQPILDTMKGQLEALTFCENLRDRAGLIADYDKEHYIFRHKSFREFLSALQLVKEASRQKRIKKLVTYFKEDWWEEALRFFMSKADDNMFDGFMRLFFQEAVSRELNANQQTLLQNFVREAPQRKVDALKDAVNKGDLNANQERYVLDCLKIIGTPEAVEAVEAFIEKSKEGDINLDHARDIVWELTSETRKVEKFAEKNRLTSRQDSFRNPFEDNVEYIKIPGGTYKYSITKEMVTVPDLYFCKYPVTNKRYRRFIAFLEGKEKEFQEKLPVKSFAAKLIQFSKSIKGYSEYLGNDFKEWPGKLRSGDDDDKKFNGDDQPVLGVTWYAARAYCFWVSCLEAIINRGEKLEDIKDINRLASIYRLPTEMEWEWAAGGEPDGTIREYPWPKEKGEPNPTLANYDENVGATTPVGRYPEGATPHGLMDMAGNVWEWMENYYDKDEYGLALRGGSWINDSSILRCSARSFINPDYWYVNTGFRVVRSLVMIP
ncbi:MAG: SUMF1/EgtB/PvdO family nonheme iron enzyme [Candidatus Aminicenantes bacterium]|nr:SUMF1/EgtB/PvdO family nonheme iron enzyme [Candidatus Aminicenantes bacterium]NIM80416.1 SUMF1/EgtB/PvdO family nonheme iron enzyme [Candidatus Aminicenantes bacterium]NIN19803.1 SUMF1/EgtB/PvdO family nonheme iron enzyme [Candidatus Aminicenantes bacterium]NIN43685.1 SUMF1/EgtB/PvdO family nonheme iron enzyme [Candidatus Aminicenantes bacterium]NIN86430.1 SUMF1/EgtB/PvdO family nonheme iron enzyme [Candidatus Aminicenantes bacterium]